MFSDIANIPDIPKNNSFHLIRLCCSLIVIYEHCIVLCNLSLPCINIRSIAVDIFFILSGFWVTYSLLRSNSIKDFFLKRIKKKFPEYVVVILFFSIILSFFSSLAFSDYFKSIQFWKYLIANLVTLNFIQPDLPGVFTGYLNNAVNGSLWTIKVEIGFYFVLPLIIIILSKIKENGNKLLFIILSYILSILYVPLCEKLGLPSSFENQLPAYISYFICGISVLLFWDFFIRHQNILVIISVILIALCYTFGTDIALPFCVTGVVFWMALRGGHRNTYSYRLFL